MRQLKIAKLVTKRDSESLDKYLNEISKLKMITADEEVVLAKRIQDGDEKALEKLVYANLRFVVSVAKQYQNQGLTLPDLINEGNLGLVKAAKRFDYTRGFKFISYAVWWIRQSILQALAEQARIIRLPLNKIGNITKINRAFSELEQKYEREPTAEEIAETLQLQENEIFELYQSSHRYLSMDAPLSDEDGGTLYDVMENKELPSPDQKLLKESLHQEIQRTLSFLLPREAEVVSLFFGLTGEPALSLDEIGFRYDLSRERVRQIKEKALRRLKANLHTKNLKTYLG
jgi:RNA polymerase primary sigma factor